jgi:RND superfamily putative drug exporter
MLLGRRAWWLPSWLAERLPVVDVEGAALHRKIAFSDWVAAHGTTTLLVRDLALGDPAHPLQVVGSSGKVTRVPAPPGVSPRALARVLAGRGGRYHGEIVVDGLLLPEQRELVVRRTALVELDPFEGFPVPAERRLRERARLLGRRRRTFGDAVSALVRELQSVVDTSDNRVAAAVLDAAMALAAGSDVYVVAGLEDLPDGPRAQGEALAEQLALRGQTVVLVEPQSIPVGERLTVPATDGLPGDLETSTRSSHV